MKAMASKMICETSSRPQEGLIKQLAPANFDQDHAQFAAEQDDQDNPGEQIDQVQRGVKGPARSGRSGARRGRSSAAAPASAALTHRTRLAVASTMVLA